MKEQVNDLALLLIYLTSWEEDSRKDPEQKLLRSWKGYPFAILNELTEDRLITQHRKSKSVILTESGIRKARELSERLLG